MSGDGDFLALLPKNAFASVHGDGKSVGLEATTVFAFHYSDGVIVAARAVVGGCHRWPFWCDLPVGRLSLPDLHAQADGIAKVAVRSMPPPTVAWFGLSHYREKVAPVLLSRLIREIAS